MIILGWILYKLLRGKGVEKVVELFKELLETIQWEYEYDENRKAFMTGVNIDDLGYFYILIFIYEREYVIYTIYEKNAEKEYFNMISEYLHRANYGLQNGNFEMDYGDGEIRYKVFTVFDNIDISMKIIKKSILIGVSMFIRYGEELLKIMSGSDDDPEKCIEMAERDLKEN